jgi:hypothetical protein
MSSADGFALLQLFWEFCACWERCRGERWLFKTLREMLGSGISAENLRAPANCAGRPELQKRATGQLCAGLLASAVLRLSWGIVLARIRDMRVILGVHSFAGGQREAEIRETGRCRCLSDA